MLARFKDGKVRKVLQFSEGAGIVCDNGENKYVGALGIDILYLELEDNESGKEFVKEHCWKQARVDAAIGAMTAMLASPALMEVVTNPTNVVGKSFESRVAKLSAEYADALIAELKKTNETK